MPNPRTRSLSFIVPFLTFFSILGVKPAFSACLNSAGAEKLACKKHNLEQTKPPLKNWNTDPTGLYAFYRLANMGEGQRRCRLHPTCSHFAIKSIQELGLIKGLLHGFARAQMEHSDQGGFLDRSVASDGHFIYLDPLKNWDHISDEN